MSSDPRMSLGGAKRIFPLFPCLLCYDVPANVVFSCSCGRYRPISRVIRRPAEPRNVPHIPRVTRHTPEPPMSAPVPCVNAFSLLSEESLYDSPLDLGLSMEALAAAPVPRARCHCLSAVSVRSGINAQAKPVNSSGPRAKVNSVKSAEVTFPMIEPGLVSHAPAHLGQTFVKQALSSKSTMPAPTTPTSSTLNLVKEVADIVRGLGIPC